MPEAPAPSSWEAYARELGVNLQRQRMACGFTQEALAHAAGLTRTHYQQIERGFWKKDQPANTSIKVLARISQALGIEVAGLLPSVAQLAWPDGDL
ncbi:XRE family transcriptional regulator [Pseudoclavibacter sp. AY1F1]|uniref:helix-turn-helix domain-containing protein n=1 Tax=Pseudoclavibacter sp. AY1F1 TaxID=2080583 RepID=UPI000CE8DA23|nr:helix-turn-helix transcriptional regulator [Pseudoclavibacter sp. AY1F1]PPF44866.1 XRE family transcriptional regulator [Pseudoclavibacter sp. AY1F1]